MPVFLTANNLKDFIGKDLQENSTPIIFRDLMNPKNPQYITDKPEKIKLKIRVRIEFENKTAKFVPDENGQFLYDTQKNCAVLIK